MIASVVVARVAVLERTAARQPWSAGGSERIIDTTVEPLIALAVLVPLLAALFFVFRILPFAHEGPWRIIWLMAALACLMFIAAEVAALTAPDASGLALGHQEALFGAILAVCVGFYLAHSVGYRIAERARVLSLTDPLTRLSNRRAFEERLTIAIERREPFTLVYVDLDGFKKVNDTQGHGAGDAVLRSVAAILRTAGRNVDIAAGWAGTSSRCSSCAPMSRRPAPSRSACSRRPPTRGSPSASPSASHPRLTAVRRKPSSMPRIRRCTGPSARAGTELPSR